jgi:transposase-like protein
MAQPTKRTWTKWRRLIREQERSGQSVAEFCREHELHASYFFAWRKRLRESAGARFLEVQVAEPRPHTSGDLLVELRLQNGRSLLVGRGFDAEHVRVLLALAEAAE